MKRFLIVLGLVLTLPACVGPANKNDKPNGIQRASILSAGKKSITIEHSQWGKPIAFGMAEKHCDNSGKEAVYQGASQQYGPDAISSWICE